MLYVFKFFKKLLIYLCIVVYWIIFVVTLSFYYIGYTLWFLKIPKNWHVNFNNWLENFFKKEIKKIKRDIEFDQNRSVGTSFQRGVDPKAAMGIGDKLAKEKHKLFQKFRLVIGLIGISFISLILLYFIFIKLAIVLTGVLIITFIVFMSIK